MEQQFVLLGCEGRCLGGQTVQDDRCLQFEIMVVGKLQEHIGKAELIELPHVAHLQYLHPIAVGNEAQLLSVVFFLPGFHPIVVVLHHHEQVVGVQLLLTVENGSSDSFVVDVCPFVTSGNHHGLIDSHLGIRTVELFHEFVARNHLDISEGMEVDAR